MPKVMKMAKTDAVKENNSSSSTSVWQMWHQKGQRCPKGTVPIRRSSVPDVLRAKSLYDFGKKSSKYTAATSSGRRADAPDVVSGNGHEHAIAYTTGSGEVYGAKATINVWDPSIEELNEFSLSQLWLLSGSFDGSDLNSIEAGWQVSPELYGDSRPRLFTYWTSDSYQATGCYNLLCSGFIQTNSRIAIGAAISPVSAIHGNQYDITILIWKDPKLGNWWMGFGDSTLVGYWPTELFTHLTDRATMVEWGGEVVNSRANDAHTSTQMGSGHYAEDGFGKASYFRNLEIVDSDNSLSSAQDISTLAENTNCYNIKSSYNNEWGTHFYYGGPGKSPQCP
ncbi:carboxyl-terminal peptidase [Perilla frutescens var. frutescens]|nr:carboxyl-terminal peptidase [Perilla frutescens var. frutescens]